MRTDTWIDSEPMLVSWMFGTLPPWPALMMTFSLTRNLSTLTEWKSRGEKLTHSYLVDEAVSDDRVVNLKRRIYESLQAPMTFKFSAELGMYHPRLAKRRFTLFFWMHRLATIARQQLYLAVRDGSSGEPELTSKPNSSSRLKIL